MSGWPISPQAHRPQRQHQASFMSSYANSPLSRSTVDLSDVTHEYEPDVDADGYRRLGHLNPEDSHIGLLSSSHTSSRTDMRTGRPTSKHAGSDGLRAGSRSKSNKRHDFTSERPESFTFEHEPDADADGYRHHHGDLNSPALRALPEATVPLDPRAGRVIITPSPSLRPHHSPYKHMDGFPTKSIEDLRDPEELHSHADMIYGIDESKARDYSVPQWMEGESSRLIEEASHGDLRLPEAKAPPAVPAQRPVPATGETHAPTGQALGDRDSVGPTRPMRDDERKGIAGAYTQDGEGSAGLPFDENTKAPAKEGDVVVQDEGDAPPSMSDSIETVRAHRPSAIFSALRRPEHKGVDAIAPVPDIKIPSQLEAQDNDSEAPQSAVKDERPDWLRAAELMANNDWERLEREKLVKKSTLEEEEQAAREGTSAPHKARAALLRADKLARGTSYPSAAEAEAASRVGTPAEELAASPLDRQPATAGKFLGLSSDAAVGARVPRAAQMTDGRDAKAREETGGLSTAPAATGSTTTSAAAAPKVPARPVKKEASNTETVTAPAIPARPVKQNAQANTETAAADKTQQEQATQETASAEAPRIPARPQKESSLSRDTGLATAPAKPAVPARPVPGKLAGTSKFAFASALEAKLKAGAPSALGLKKQTSHDDHGERAAIAADEASPAAGAQDGGATLTDARKGRPTRRRAPAASTAAAPTTSSSMDTTEMAPAPVCETGETFTSRFGVEMRSMSIQTGVITIDSPTMNLTVMVSAGRDGEDVVVDAKQKKPVQDQNATTPTVSLQPATHATASATREDGQESALALPTVSLEEAAGGELRSLEKNDLTADTNASAAHPASDTPKHAKAHFSDDKGHEEDSPATTERKRHLLEDELEVVN